MNPVEYAELIARRAHSGKVRRGGETAIAHSARVAKAVRHLGDEFQMVAWLHDVIESTSDGFSRSPFSHPIRDHCGDEVLRLVQILTHSPFPAISGGYESYIDRVADNPITRAVKIADILDNLFDKPTDDAKQRYQAALQTLCFRKPQAP